MEAHLSIQHPEYHRPSFANDLTLIKLEELVPQSDTIRNIGLSQCPTAGDSCLVSGWGRLANGELGSVGVSGLSEGVLCPAREANPMLCVPGRLPKVLQCVNMSVVSEEICSELYAPVYHPSMFCAGGGQDQKDSCHVRDGRREEGRRSREQWRREGTGNRGEKQIREDSVTNGERD